MKNIKKILMLLPLTGLFLSGCSFDDFKGKISDTIDIWSGKKDKEEQSSDKPNEQSQETEKEEEKHDVNALWPASDISSYTTSMEIDETIPGYTGEASEIKFSASFAQIEIVLKESTVAAEQKAKETYIADLTRAEYQEAQYNEYTVYTSKTRKITLLIWGSSEAASDPKAGSLLIDIYPVYSPATAINSVVNMLNEVLTSTVEATHDNNGDYVVVNLGSAEIERIQMYVEYCFVPNGFVTEATSWNTGTFSDGSEYIYVDFECAYVGLRYTIYSISEGGDYDGNYLHIFAGYIYED